MYNPQQAGGYGPQGYPDPHGPPQPCPPQYLAGNPAAGNAGTYWSSGLCQCCNDPANCLITAVCPCVTFGQIAEIVDKGQVSCCACGTIYALLLGSTGLSCLYSCFYRSRLRVQYNLVETPADDCLVHFCCETCALCQEYRELKNRGFDMGIGWQANMNRQSRGITIPPMQGGMTR